MAHRNKAKFPDKPYQQGRAQKGRPVDQAEHSRGTIPNWTEPSFIVSFTLNRLMPIQRQLSAIEQPQQHADKLRLITQSRGTPGYDLAFSTYSTSIQTQILLLEQKQLEYDNQMSILGSIARRIDHQEKYYLLWEYQNYHDDIRHKRKLNEEEDGLITSTLSYMFWGVCLSKKAIPIGAGDYFFNKSNYKLLWIPIPPLLSSASKDATGNMEMYCQYNALQRFAPVISGSPSHRAYDQLLIPGQDTWPSVVNIVEANPLKLEKIIAHSLGKTDGFFSQADLEHLLEQIALRSKWVLVSGRPVLIRLTDHPLIHQVVLMRKGDFIIAKLETHQYGDWLEIISLNTVFWAGIFKNFKVDGIIYKDMDSGVPKASYRDDLDNLAVPGLIATLCLDLVTVKEVFITHKRSIANTNSRQGTGESTDTKKWYWQYLPRKKYSRQSDSQNESAEIIAERVDLNPKQIDLQDKLRRFHMVGLYVRKLPINCKPSPEKVAQAVELGLELGDGETWVAAHGRGVQELKRVVEDIGIDNIPHFMRQRAGLKVSSPGTPGDGNAAK